MKTNIRIFLLIPFLFTLSCVSEKEIKKPLKSYDWKKIKAVDDCWKKFEDHLEKLHEERKITGYNSCGLKYQPKDKNISKVFFWGVPKEEIPKVIALFLDGLLKNEYRNKKQLLIIYFFHKREGTTPIYNEDGIKPGNLIMKMEITLEK